MAPQTQICFPKARILKKENIEVSHWGLPLAFSDVLPLDALASFTSLVLGSPALYVASLVPELRNYTSGSCVSSVSCSSGVFLFSVFWFETYAFILTVLFSVVRDVGCHLG